MVQKVESGRSKEKPVGIEDLQPTLRLLLKMQETGLTDTLSSLVENFDVIFNIMSRKEVFDLISFMLASAKMVSPLANIVSPDADKIRELLADLPSVMEEAREKAAAVRQGGLLRSLDLLKDKNILTLIELMSILSSRLAEEKGH